MKNLTLLILLVFAAPFGWSESSGTGFFVSSEGHIVTNNHVIENCERISFFAAGASFNATVLATDNVNDLALLGSEYPNPMHLHVGQAEPSLMEEVFVAGYPFGDAVSSTLKVTRGIVSSLAGIANNYSNIQIDAAIQPGNSGGPIVNSLGEVVAVAVSKLDARAALQNFGALPEGVNFGIKGLIVGNLLSANQIQSTAKLHQNPSTKELASLTSQHCSLGVRESCDNPRWS